MNPPVVLVTGAAKRIGAAIADFLHRQGMNVCVHYHHSERKAHSLCAKFNTKRENSAIALQANLNVVKECTSLINTLHTKWGKLDGLINNASSFYPTPIQKATEEQWEDLIGSNVKAPFFLSQAAAPFLKQTQGCIVNIADIHADKPLKNYPIYCIAKAGLVMLTKSLARELGPEIRVNAVAPGLILWPEDQNEVKKDLQQQIIAKTLLKRQGKPQDIAQTVYFLLEQPYITGQVIAVS